MLRTLTTALLFYTISVACGQITETRNSLFKQLIDEIKLDAINYKQVDIDGLILWDTSGYVFKKYFTSIDTTDQNDFVIKHTPTRKKIIAFSKLVTNEDYISFMVQAKNQNSDNFLSPMTIKGNKKLKTKLNITFSQPLVSIDNKTVIIQRIQKYFVGNRLNNYSKSTTVYIWTNNNWVVWDYLERMQPVNY
jgi:hypothetical protein